MLKGGIYLACGDSWTWSPSTVMTMGKQFYANQIRDLIRSNYGFCRLINKGIGGNDSNEMVQNIPWIFNVDADLITIGMGINDCANQTVPVATYTSNMNKIVDAAKTLNPRAHIIICTPGQTLDLARTPYIQSYRDAVVAVAQSQEVSICHFDDAWASGDSATYLQSDDIHPNSDGHIKLTDALWPIVQQGSWLENLQK